MFERVGSYCTSLSLLSAKYTFYNNDSESFFGTRNNAKMTVLMRMKRIDTFSPARTGPLRCCSIECKIIINRVRAGKIILTTTGEINGIWEGRKILFNGNDVLFSGSPKRIENHRKNISLHFSYKEHSKNGVISRTAHTSWHRFSVERVLEFFFIEKKKKIYFLEGSYGGVSEDGLRGLSVACFLCSAFKSIANLTISCF